MGPFTSGGLGGVLVSEAGLGSAFDAASVSAALSVGCGFGSNLDTDTVGTVVDDLGSGIRLVPVGYERDMTKQSKPSTWVEPI